MNLNKKSSRDLFSCFFILSFCLVHISRNTKQGADFNSILAFIMMFDENNKIFFYLIQFIKLTIFVTRKYNVMCAPVKFL